MNVAIALGELRARHKWQIRNYCRISTKSNQRKVDNKNNKLANLL